MNAPSRPLILPSIGGRHARRQRWRQIALTLFCLAILAVIYVASRPRVAARPIANLQKNGVHGVYNLHAKNRELLIYNFRSIEAGRLYRASGFPRNHRGVLNGKMGLYPAAFFDAQAFEFLRSHNIRTVYCLDNERETAALKGYLNFWARRRDYRISLINYPLPPEKTYSRDTREQNGGLRRALEFLEYMKMRDEPGAVLLMGESGKDAVGLVAAAYELWRNVGTAPANEVWSHVKARYLLSNVLIDRDKDARKVASKAKCREAQFKWVCPETLEVMRPHLERIAQMD